VELLLLATLVSPILVDRKDHRQAVRSFAEDPSEANRAESARQQDITANSRRVVLWIIVPLLIANTAALFRCTVRRTETRTPQPVSGRGFSETVYVRATTPASTARCFE